MLKRRVGITTKTTAIIVAAIILVVAGGTSAYYLTLPTKPPPGGTVKVGFSISLTGNFNVEGAASLNGNHPSDKLAVIYASDSFSTTAALAAINYSKAQGFQVVYQSSYPTTVNDVTPQLTAAKSAGADDLLGGGHFNDGLLLAKQLA